MFFVIEEIGHAIDIRLNGTNDSDGDEGAVFSAMIRGVDRPKMELNQKDQYLLEIDTVSVAVEASAHRARVARAAACPTNQLVRSRAAAPRLSALLRQHRTPRRRRGLAQ